MLRRAQDRRACARLLALEGARLAAGGKALAVIEHDPESVVKVRPHEATGRRLAGEIRMEWAEDDWFVLEVEVIDRRPRRGEGFALTVDHCHAGMSFAGAVSAQVALSLSEREARQLHAKLGRMLRAA